jgi:hypothetical protein
MSTEIRGGLAAHSGRQLLAVVVAFGRKARHHSTSENCDEVLEKFA